MLTLFALHPAVQITVVVVAAALALAALGVLLVFLLTLLGYELRWGTQHNACARPRGGEAARVEAFARRLCATAELFGWKDHEGRRLRPWHALCEELRSAETPSQAETELMQWRALAYTAIDVTDDA